MSQDCDGLCGAAPKFVLSCSGAADVGEVADQAARQLTREGTIKMYCLAGIGGRVPGIIKNVKAASQVVTIDGCPQGCAKKSLEEAGFSNFESIQLDDLGLKKGASEATPENIGVVVDTVNTLVG